MAEPNSEPVQPAGGLPAWWTESSSNESSLASQASVTGEATVNPGDVDNERRYESVADIIRKITEPEPDASTYGRGYSQTDDGQSTLDGSSQSFANHEDPSAVSAEQYSADQYSADQYSADQYSDEQYSAESRHIDDYAESAFSSEQLAIEPEAQPAPNQFDASAYDLRQFNQSTYEVQQDQAQYNQAAYEQSQYEKAQNEKAQYEKAQYEKAQYEQAQYEQAQLEQSQYEASQYEPSQYAPSQYEPGQYGDAQYEPGQYQRAQDAEQSYETPDFPIESAASSPEQLSDSNFLRDSQLIEYDSSTGDTPHSNSAYGNSNSPVETDFPANAFNRFRQDRNISDSAVPPAGMDSGNYVPLEDFPEEPNAYDAPSMPGDMPTDYGQSETPTDFDTQSVREANRPVTDTVTTTASTTVTAASIKDNSHEDGDESVEDYMRRLLARMRGVSESEVTLPGLDQPKAPAEPARPSQVAADKSADASAIAEPISDAWTEPFDPDKYVPRGAAPEKNRDLNALRELANNSARSAIQVSARRRQGTAILVKSTIALVGLIAGFAIISINGARMNIAFIATIASFMVAIIWGYDTISSLRPLLHATGAPKKSEAKASR